MTAELESFIEAYENFRNDKHTSNSLSKKYFEDLEKAQDKLLKANPKADAASAEKAEQDFAGSVMKLAAARHKADGIIHEGYKDKYATRDEQGLPAHQQVSYLNQCTNIAQTAEKEIQAHLLKPQFSGLATNDVFIAAKKNAVSESINVTRSEFEGTFAKNQSSVTKAITDNAWKDFSSQFHPTELGTGFEAASTVTRVTGKAVGLGFGAAAKVASKLGAHGAADGIEKVGKAAEKGIETVSKGLDVASGVANMVMSPPEHRLADAAKITVKLANKIADKIEGFIENKSKMQDPEFQKNMKDVAKTVLKAQGFKIPVQSMRTFSPSATPVVAQRGAPAVGVGG